MSELGSFLGPFETSVILVLRRECGEKLMFSLVSLCLVPTSQRRGCSLHRSQSRVALGCFVRLKRHGRIELWTGLQTGWLSACTMYKSAEQDLDIYVLLPRTTHTIKTSMRYSHRNHALQSNAARHTLTDASTCYTATSEVPCMKARI
jgi:hypothetical protein